MKIKKNIIKTMCAALACTTIMSNLISVYATETIITESPMDESSGTDSSDSSWTTEENSFEDIKVTYQQSSSYTVTIPKTIALDTNKQAAYSVKVSGNIDANQRVYVAPVDGIADSENMDFYMNDLSGKKANIVATVTQNKTCWNSEEVANAYEETNNSVSAPDLTAGTWEGTFQVEIRLETEKAHEHNYVDGKCECGEIDPNHEHNYVDGTCTICGKGDSYDIAPAEAYSNWNYTLDDANNIITLNYYKGSEANVVVYANYEINGKTYKTKLATYGENGTKVYHPTYQYMFAGNTKVQSIIFSENIDTSNITGMRGMFSGCTSLASLDLSSLDTSNVTDMSALFNKCTSLTSIDVSSLDTSNVTNMNAMFWGCTALKSLDVSSWNTSNVKDMSYTFAQCSSLTSLDLGNFNTSNVTDMSYIFYYCGSLISLDLSGLDTSNVINMGSMFSECTSLKSLDLSNFDTGKVTDMSHMFKRTALTSLDLSSFEAANVDMSYMFSYCSELNTIYVSKAKWSTTQANKQNMFSNCGTSSLTYVE